MRTIFLLIVVHYLADFGLQNDFIAKFKVPGSAPFWFHVMIAHCAMQALGVFLVTQNVYIAIGEFVAHGTIDILKCKGKLSFNQDQMLHIVCKFIWWGVITL